MPYRYIVKGQPVTEAKQLLSQLMRKDMTPAESILWEALRGNKLGVRFRRQQVIAGFIVDFYCHNAGLIIEADGSQHSLESDCERDAVLSSRGIKILRFSNEEILVRLEEVLRRIREAM